MFSSDVFCLIYSFKYINLNLNLLLNTLKLLQTKFNIDFNSRVQVGDTYLYVSDSKINEEINNIFIQLNMIKLTHNLSLPLFV